MDLTVVERQIGRHTLRIETGRFARQAAGAVVVRYADTVVLGAALTGPPREGVDFFPLTVDYREKTYAAGKFPGGFFKRETRPSNKEILTMRMIDRPVRPLFPDGYKDEVLIQTMVLATDQENDPDILAMVAASAALSVSQIPFEGPLGAVRVGYLDGQYVLNPTLGELEYSSLEMVLSGHREAINMIEVRASEVSEDVVIGGIEFGYQAIRQICEMIEELQQRAGKEKTWTPPPPTDDLEKELRKEYAARLKAVRQVPGKQERYAAQNEVFEAAKAQYLVEGDPGSKARWNTVRELLDRIDGELLAEMVVRKKQRPDGRGAHDIRPLECEVGLLPRVHGSAVFQRGETQSLCVVTLGTGRDEQIVDGLTEEYSKKFMLHYNFPPLCTGEIKRIGAASRREIGHGALAEKSLESVLPAPEKFPYTIRLVSEVLESNGSSSMASVCGGCLALMDAGVPIKQPVAGISIGWFQCDGKDQLVVDILGEEDHHGLMDFKVAGTQRGVTGVQLDLKARGLPQRLIPDIFQLAREARLQILRTMLTCLGAPRKQISDYAPRILTIKIDPEKIGKVIGPGGKGIKAIEAETKATIDIEEDGTIMVCCIDMERAQRAVEMIEAVTAEVKLGKIYKGRVVSIKDFGAFIEIGPGQEGLCHISELDTGYVKSVDSVLKFGDEVRVKVIAIDDQGRVKLSRKAAMMEEGAPV
ncbi:MAG TPA: polyribonucleotide nucleotidyltransferase [Phycisphaerae bacterium]|nr:polyribonucleotide nucleotidyltransferase [Phycisphaerae bacterium]HNU43946.1 polyribonucleotide nucleotidyltransferase [Phycisphaerae bacterium]